jgi:hypothetical protein
MTRKPDPTPTETPKRASPTPTAETLAIRALRDVRALDAAIAKLMQQAKDKEAERAELLDALPEEAKRILGVLNGAGR